MDALDDVPARTPARTPMDVLTDPDLIEQLAGAEHERWSHWQRYMHSKCTMNDDGSLTIPSDLVERWTHQARTTYEDLDFDQQQSDRDQVRRYLPIIREALRLHPWKPT